MGMERCGGEKVRNCDRVDTAELRHSCVSRLGACSAGTWSLTWRWNTKKLEKTMWHFQHLAFFFFDVSHILIRLRKTGEGTFTIRGFHKMGFHTGIVKKGTATIKKNYYQKKDYYKKGRLLSKGTTGKRDYYQKRKIKGYRKGKTFTRCAFSLM